MSTTKQRDITSLLLGAPGAQAERMPQYKRHNALEWSKQQWDVEVDVRGCPPRTHIQTHTKSGSLVCSLPRGGEVPAGRERAEALARMWARGKLRWRLPAAASLSRLLVPHRPRAPWPCYLPAGT